MLEEKADRQRVILHILETDAVSSQELLRRKLSESGYEVTQATLSRDLRELGVVKRATAEGMVCYGRPDPPRESSVLAVHLSENLLIVRTQAGMAAAVAYRIDSMAIPEVLGTVAGEDTLLVVLREGCDRQGVRGEVATRLLVR